MPTVVSIGDGIVDAVEFTPGKTERFPGGARSNRCALLGDMH